MTSLKLTAEGNINFQDALAPATASRTTLTLNENKRNVVSGQEWEGLTWKEIVFEQ